MIVRYAPNFLTTLKKQNVIIRKGFKTRTAIFYQDHNNPRLDNHPLKKQWLGYRSIDINANWRAIYKEIQEGNSIVAYFVAIGTHKELHQ